ncbi:hypothetical protein [Oryzihumus leptocrescens]|uniref:Lipoprotein n=1 Tax=Oryzihumus leptocrescens TaxID=297536 RepID=A0A542ZNB6_9MICO|nr:hypothetical protein [Oryzihumus leptocrescens]TQL61797.1 hypothetical protein FB474_3216 [Oryzihumus leptocrescens]
MVHRRWGAARPAVLACGALVVVAGCASAAVRPASTAATVSRTTTSPSAEVTITTRCPERPEALTPSMATAAFAAVVRYNERDPGFTPATLRQDRVVPGPDAGPRGEQAAAECGAAVAARTFVVMTTRTDLLPAQSASQGVWFVSRVDGRFVVWQRVH